MCDSDDDETAQYGQHYDTTFALSHETTHKLNQSSCNTILKSTAALIDKHVVSFRKAVMSELQKRGMETDVLGNISHQMFNIE